MRLLVVLLSLFGITSSFAADKYILAGASGSGSGDDWTNAYATFSAAGLDESASTAARGNTYYVADGSYSSVRLQNAVSGTTVISIIKAIESDHGTDTGWDSSYGDGQATFSNILWAETGYWLIDGNANVGSYGFRIDCTSTGGTILSLGKSSNILSDITIKSLEIDASALSGGHNGVAWVGTPRLFYNLHLIEIDGDAFATAGNSDAVIEYCHVDVRGEPLGVHADCIAVQAGNTGELIIRHNIFDWTGQILWFDGQGSATYSGAEVYGNVFTNSASTSPPASNVGIKSHASATVGSLIVYNNTFVGISNPHSETGDSGSIFKNNIYWNLVSTNVPFGSGTHDYNWFDTSLDDEGESNDVRSGTHPFTSYTDDGATNDDFTLASGTLAGETFSSPYDTDRLGKDRAIDGAWDRGAYEFDSLDDNGLVDYPDGGTNSTEFPGSSLEPGWSFVDPSTDASLVVSNGKAKITFPATDHNPGTGSPDPGTGATRIERAQADADFDVTMAMSSCAFETGALTGYGILVEFDDGSSARNDVYLASSGILDNYYVEVRSAGTQSTDESLLGMATFIRLTRAGDDFVFYCSLNGTDWQAISSYTTVGTVDTLGFYGFNAGGSPIEHTAEIEYIHFNTDLPTVNDPVTRTDLLLVDGSALDAGEWSDDSATGGTVISSGGELDMTVTTTDGSTARFASVDAALPANVGILAKFRDDAAGSSDLFFGLAVRGYGGWQSQYAPKAHVFEGSPGATLTRLVKQSITHATPVDGGLWSYPQVYTATAMPLTETATWIRYEAIGPIFRVRTWADGDSEPATWEAEYVDHHIYGDGQVGVGFSKNNSSGASGTIVLEEMAVYEITKSSGATVATPTFDPVEGTYEGTQNVTISCATGSSTIYYTADGSTPDNTDSVYSTAIEVASTTTIKAIAEADGYDDSAVATALFTITEPDPGTSSGVPPLLIRRNLLTP